MKKIVKVLFIGMVAVLTGIGVKKIIDSKRNEK